MYSSNMDLSSPSHRASVAVQRFRLTNNRRCYKSSHRCFKYGHHRRQNHVFVLCKLSTQMETLLHRSPAQATITQDAYPYEAGSITVNSLSKSSQEKAN
jgi:hypothetical protein